MRSFVLDYHHPEHAETIMDHAEAWREERLRERHLHVAAVAQRAEDAVGIAFGRRRDRQSEALEARRALAMAVRHHHDLVADAKARVHDLVLAAGRHHAGLRRLGAVLVAHQHLHVGAERPLVEPDRFLAATIEEQIRLDFHDISFSRVAAKGCGAGASMRRVLLSSAIGRTSTAPARAPGILAAIRIASLRSRASIT